MLRPHSKTYQDKDAAYTRILFERRKLSVLGLRPLERTGRGRRKGRNMGRERRGTKKKEGRGETRWGYGLHCVFLNIFPRPKSVTYADKGSLQM